MTQQTKIDWVKYISIRNSLTMEEMFLLYNTLNHFVNSKEYYTEDIRQYKKLAKKIREMLVK